MRKGLAVLLIAATLFIAPVFAEDIQPNSTISKLEVVELQVTKYGVRSITLFDETRNLMLKFPIDDSPSMTWIYTNESTTYTYDYINDLLYIKYVEPSGRVKYEGVIE